MGVAAQQPVTTFFTGDASLRRRPMGRVMAPLAQTGVHFATRAGGRLPAAVTGPETLLAIAYHLPVASAPVQSAVLLAGLAAAGENAGPAPQPPAANTTPMLRPFEAEA